MDFLLDLGVLAGFSRVFRGDAGTKGSRVESFSIWVKRLDFFLLDLGVLGGFSRDFGVDCSVHFSGVVAIGSIESSDKRREDRRVGVGVEAETMRDLERLFGVLEIGV